jgi:signal transduction histidine kinase
MTQSGYALIGLTVIVAVLAAVLAFAALRFGAAARDTRRHLGEGNSETAVLSAALQEAVAKLRAQERAMSARAVASEQLSGQIVDSLTAGLLVVDGAGHVEILNPAGRRLLGVTTDPAGAAYRNLLAVAPPLADVIAECLETGDGVVRRALRMPSTVAASHLGVTVSPLAGDASRGVICLFADLTNVVALEDQLRLKDTLARLGELTAGIAHEFRNGLATIHGYSRLIDPDLLPAPYRPYVDGIRQETEAMGRVVTNFLAFARPDKVAFGEVDIGALVSRAVEDARHDMPAATMTVGGAFGTIEGDDVLLRQMLGNLIRNAVDASQDAGIAPRVTIVGEPRQADGTLCLAVEDNGPGIAADARDQIFRPFFTTKPQGTGLGLAIVQKVVVIHDGRIAVTASTSGGARFEIVLPMRQA